MFFCCSLKCLVIQFKTVKIKLSSCFAIAFHRTLCYIGLFLLISTPPPPPTSWLRTYLFFLPLKNSIKLQSPLKTFINCGSTHEEYGFIPKEFREKVSFPCLLLKMLLNIKALPTKNSIFFNFNPKEILNFFNLPCKNSTGSQSVVGSGVLVL